MDNSSPESRLIDSTPVATKDLSQAKKDLDKFGFCLVPDVLTGSDLQEARQRLTDQAEAEEEQGLSFRDGGLDQNIYLPGNKNQSPLLSSPVLSLKKIILNRKLSDSLLFN